MISRPPRRAPRRPGRANTLHTRSILRPHAPSPNTAFTCSSSTLRHLLTGALAQDALAPPRRHTLALHSTDNSVLCPLRSHGSRMPRRAQAAQRALSLRPLMPPPCASLCMPSARAFYRRHRLLRSRMPSNSKALTRRPLPAPAARQPFPAPHALCAPTSHPPSRVTRSHAPP